MTSQDEISARIYPKNKAGGGFGKEQCEQEDK